MRAASRCFWSLLPAFCPRRAGAIETGNVPLPGWITNPIASHVSYPVERDLPTSFTLFGYDEEDRALEFYVQTLPDRGLLYETSGNYRQYGSDPKQMPDPIGPHQLPFRVSDPFNRLVYVPPFNQWEPEGKWSSFTYVTKVTTQEGEVLTSEPGMAVLANPLKAIVQSGWDLTASVDGWKIDGNLAPAHDLAGGLRHQSQVWGKLSNYVYGVDEVQHVDFATGFDNRRWYFIPPERTWLIPEVVAAYGGAIKFTIRSLYGNFSQMNSPLDWITLECASCNSDRGARIVKFVDALLWWDGREKEVEIPITSNYMWMKDPMNHALNYTYASMCEMVAVLSNLTRIAILGDFTRGGEGVAIDDVMIVAADANAMPGVPWKCQRGCVCVHNPAIIRPTCC